MTKVRFQRPSLLVVLALALASTPPASADVVTLVNGQKIEGVIIQETPERVRLRTSSGEVPLPRSTIASIDKDTEEVNALGEADSQWRTGNIAGGIRSLMGAAARKVPDEDLAAFVVRGRPYLLRSIDRMPTDEQSETRYQLEQVHQAVWATAETQFVLAEAFERLRAPHLASDALVAAGIEAITSDRVRERWSRDFFRTYIRKLAIQGDYRDAVEQIERLRLLSENDAQGQEPLLVLAEAARARESGDYETSLRLISEQIHPTFPEVARNRAVSTLRLLTGWAEKNEREDDARQWITKYLSEILPVEAAASYQRLVHSEAARQLRFGNPALALRIVEQIPEEERSQELDQLWAESRFETELESLGEEDPIALFDLAIWGGEQGLYDLSIPVLDKLRENETLQKSADEQLVILKHKRDLELLAQAQEAYDGGLLTETIELTNKILQDPDRESPAKKQANELAEVSRKELDMEEQRRPYQAEAFYQMAERAYFTEQVDESWRLIELLMRHYPDTPAAQRAASLLPDVARAFELQFIEGKRTALPGYDFTIDQGAVQQTDKLAHEVAELMKALGTS